MTDIDNTHNDCNVFDRPKEVLDPSDLADTSDLDWVDKELRLIRSIPLLADGEDVVLHRLWCDGDKAAGDRLVNSHRHQALAFARKRYRAEGASHPMRLMELLSAGDFALCLARKNFDPDSGYSFATYAWKTLNRTILQEAIHLSSVTTPEGKHIKIGATSPNYRAISVRPTTKHDGTDLELSYDDIKLGARHACKVDDGKHDDPGTTVETLAPPRDAPHLIRDCYARVIEDALAESVLGGHELHIYKSRRQWPPGIFCDLGAEYGKTGEWARKVLKAATARVEAARASQLAAGPLRRAMAQFYSSFHFVAARSFDEPLDERLDKDTYVKRFPDAKQEDRIHAHQAADVLRMKHVSAVLDRVRANDLRNIPVETVVDLRKKIAATEASQHQVIPPSRAGHRNTGYIPDGRDSVTGLGWVDTQVMRRGKPAKSVVIYSFKRSDLVTTQCKDLIALHERLTNSPWAGMERRAGGRLNYKPQRGIKLARRGDYWGAATYTVLWFGSDQDIYEDYQKRKARGEWPGLSGTGPWKERRKPRHSYAKLMQRAEDADKLLTPQQRLERNHPHKLRTYESGGLYTHGPLLRGLWHPRKYKGRTYTPDELDGFLATRADLPQRPSNIIQFPVRSTCPVQLEACA